MQLVKLKKDSTTFLAVGNELRADDGAGIYIGKALLKQGYNVIICHSNPENFLDRITTEAVVILDAAVYSGSSQFVLTQDLAIVSPTSTHNFSLKLIFDILTARGKTVFLAGIKPQDLSLGKKMTEEVKKRADALIVALSQMIR